MMLQKGIFKEAGLLTKILHLFFAIIFFTLFALAAWQLFTDKDTTNTQTLKLLQLFQSLGMFIIPPFVLAYLWSEKPFSYLKLNTSVHLWDVFMVILIMILAIPAINLLSAVNQQLVLPDFLHSFEEWMKSTEAETAITTQKFVQVKGIGALAFNIFLMAIIPALGEELFFRGTVQKIFTEWKKAIPAIWITAVIFSIIHFQFYGFVPRMLLGAYFGYLLFWSGNLWLPIIAHFINNALAVLFYYLKFNGYKVIDIDTIGTGNTIWLGILSLIVTLGSIIMLRKSFLNRNK
ncbi:MAG TPA: CPBP family intramembrane metalloprotease [Paludibacter sp.]|nr:CPBP family intramembrane metalloprotease [Paludibacter sp.]